MIDQTKQLILYRALVDQIETNKMFTYLLLKSTYILTYLHIFARILGVEQNLLKLTDTMSLKKIWNNKYTKKIMKKWN